MHCPCCCSAKGSGGIGTALIIGLGIYLASRSATVIAAIHAFLITVITGEACLTVIIITALILSFRHNRPIYRNPPANAEVSDDKPAYVITSAPERSIAAPAASKPLGIEPPRITLNGAPVEPASVRRARPGR